MIGLGGSSHRGISCNEEEEEERWLEKSRLRREVALMAGTRFINEGERRGRESRNERRRRNTDERFENVWTFNSFQIGS